MPQRHLGLLGLIVSAALLATAASVPPAVSQSSGPKAEELTPEEIKERDARKGCRISICSAFHVRKAGPDIACDVLKSWRKDHITRMASKGGLNWIWGKARCTATINLKRQDLINAVAQGDFEMKLAPHAATCEIERENDQPYTMKVKFQPTVGFKAGKAVKAAINWGDIEAPTLIRVALGTMTAADNRVSALQPSIVADINDFIEQKCLEIKDEWEK